MMVGSRPTEETGSSEPSEASVTAPPTVTFELSVEDGELLQEMSNNWSGWADLDRKKQIRAYIALRIAQAKRTQGVLELKEGT